LSKNSFVPMTQIVSIPTCITHLSYDTNCKYSYLYHTPPSDEATSVPSTLRWRLQNTCTLNRRLWQQRSRLNILQDKMKRMLRRAFFKFCTMTNKRTITSQIITLLHVSTLSCHPQGAVNQYLAKLHQYFKCSCL
jgi:hypothetical protein